MNSYRIKKERQRILFSSLTVFGSTIFIFLLFFLLDLLKFEDFNEYTGPVKITFGTEDGLVLDEPITEPILDTPVEDIEPVEEVIIEPEPVVESEIIESVSEEIKNDIPKIEETEKTEVVKEVIKKPVAEPKPVVQEGRESGNSHETTFDSESSKIGRRAYFPIIDFMPLPKRMSMDVYALIQADNNGLYTADENKEIFKKYYSDRGTYFSLISSVPLGERPDLWAILKAAGYDVENAEYKTKNILKTAILSFEINSNSKGSNAIKSVEITTSSGNTEIDEAIIYGFKQSTYSNSTDDSVTGRFKYSFN